MSPHLRTTLSYIGTLVIITAAVFVLIGRAPVTSPTTENPASETSQTASVIEATPTYASTSPSASLADEKQELDPTHIPQPKNEEGDSLSAPPALGKGSTSTSVVRIQNPYPFPPLSFLTVNEQTRAALVNILCTSQSGSLRPASGSGIVIDPRGIVLTNAHVAQYVLLAQSSQTNLSCFIRSGAPARALWSAEVLYIPPVWIEEHAADIMKTNPTGTGEHDYALLRITGIWDDPTSPSLPTKISALPLDTREAIGFPGDLVLAASYPAEFIGGIAAQSDLYPASTIAPIRELLTFQTNTADLVALSGVIEAQSGSSGGPVVNAWGRVIGIITTTSEGTTTAERDLRAITLSYIDRDLSTQMGIGLAEILGNDTARLAEEFRAQQAPALTRLLIEQITRRSR